MQVRVYLEEQTVHADYLKNRSFRWCKKHQRWEKTVRSKERAFLQGTLKSVLDDGTLIETAPEEQL